MAGPGPGCLAPSASRRPVPPHPCPATGPWWTGAQTRLPTGPASLLATGALGVRDKAQFARLLTRLPKLRPSSLAGTLVAEWLGAEESARVEAVVRHSYA